MAVQNIMKNLDQLLWYDRKQGKSTIIPNPAKAQIQPEKGGF
jgi:hypothetical protein